MDRSRINKLIAISYKDNDLDQKMVNKITSLVSRSDLKKYINGLKLAENKKNVIISSSINNQNLDKFKQLFPHKKIIFKDDPTLMLGIKVVDNDMVYEFTLKNSLNRIIDYIEQNYD